MWLTLHNLALLSSPISGVVSKSTGDVRLCNVISDKILPLVDSTRPAIWKKHAPNPPTTYSHHFLIVCSAP
jgi:hypothetical protein